MTTPARVVAGARSMTELVDELRTRSATTTIELVVVDPDAATGAYPGELITRGGARWRHQPWRAWLELAERLDLRAGTPRLELEAEAETEAETETKTETETETDTDTETETETGAEAETETETGAPRRYVVTLTPLGAGTALPAPAPDAAERYGAGSSFDRIANLEDPSLLLDLQDAMDRIDLPPGARVLELGCGRGDLARWWCARRPDVAYLGLDHARSAIELATTGAPPGAHFEVRDVTALDGLGRFDLVIAIAVLQSRDLDDRALVQRLVTAHLAPRGAVLLGIPNHRWRDGELRPGARQKNYRQPELGPLVRDLAYYRRYLQQKRRRVFITGRHTLLVTAIVDGVDAAATA